MKKLLNNKIFTFFLGCILTGGISVFAAAINASNVDYTPSDDTWQTNNVESAINDLYKIAKSYRKLDTQTTANSNHILSNFTAYNNNGELVTGTLPTYSGNTTVTPSTSSQTLSTKGKYMNSDITVSAYKNTFGTAQYSYQNGDDNGTKTASLTLNKGKYIILIITGTGYGSSTIINTTTTDSLGFSCNSCTKTKLANKKYMSSASNKDVYNNTLYLTNTIYTTTFYVEVTSTSDTISTSKTSNCPTCSGHISLQAIPIE